MTKLLVAPGGTAKGKPMAFSADTPSLGVELGALGLMCQPWLQITVDSMGFIKYLHVVPTPEQFYQS